MYIKRKRNPPVEDISGKFPGGRLKVAKKGVMKRSIGIHASLLQKSRYSQYGGVQFLSGEEKYTNFLTL